MKSWRKICCPVDGSETSRRAAQSAVELAWAFGGQVTLLRVWAAPVAVGIEGGFAVAPSLEEVAPALREELLGLARELPEGEKAQVAVVAGSPAEEIVRFAREGEFDAIVIGTHGRTGLKHLVLGSVAEHVVRHAPCPVVVIRAA